MAQTKIIQGRIIRILDSNSVIINLGRRDGVTGDSIFKILAEPESVIDPETKEELGKVKVVKAKLKASLVEEKFTIAVTKWRNTVFNFSVGPAIGNLLKTEDVDQGDLLVRREDIEPWMAQTKIPVQLGDLIETAVEIRDVSQLPSQAAALTS